MSENIRKIVRSEPCPDPDHDHEITFDLYVINDHPLADWVNVLNDRFVQGMWIRTLHVGEQVFFANGSPSLRKIEAETTSVKVNASRLDLN